MKAMRMVAMAAALVALGLGGTPTAEAQTPARVKINGGAVDIDTGTTKVKVGRGGGVTIDDGASRTKVKARGGAAGTTSSDDDTYVVDGASQTLTHDCGKDGKVMVQGANNVVTLTGTCSSVVVQGATNRVDIDTVRRITLQGSGNSVTWLRGPNGKAPKIVRQGVGNTAARRKP